MDNFTANETWIDKLVDELVDAKDEIRSIAEDSRILRTLIDMILDESKLSDSSDSELRLNGSGKAILAFIKAYNYNSYKDRVAELKELKELKESKEAKTESSAPVVVLPEDKSARQALVDYCTEASLDINIIAKRYKLNNGSDDQEFIKALADLMAIRDSYKEA